MKRIALVVQRYGEEVNGGAELYGRWLAEHLHAAQVGQVDVLTTCALDFTTWANHYPAGTSQLNGVTIHRFPVDQPREWASFQRRTGQLFHTPHTLLDEINWVRDQGPYSTPLLQCIESQRHHYDLFIFITYVYATTYFGLPLVAEKAILVPTAHDEPYLNLPVFRPLFHLPRALVYSTYAERALVEQKTNAHHQTVSIVAGIGIDWPAAQPSADRFRHEFGVREPFALYVGRVTEGKNVPALLRDFEQYQQTAANPLPLVLAGRADIPLPAHPYLRHLGFISEQTKFDALAAAEVVIMPSLYESLSMIALEAWLMGKPMLVNGQCAVLKEQCQRSQGGLYYHTTAEFTAALIYLQTHPTQAQALGANGRAFTHATYHWDIILAKYRALIQTIW